MLLTPDELAALTGRQRPAAQVRWLRAHGWPHEIGADGRPKVLRAYAERRLGALDSTPRAPRLRLSA
jgi:hypothetical protein